MQSILYSHYEFATLTIMLRFLTETCICCGYNSVSIHKPYIYVMERENTKTGLRMLEVSCFHVCVLTRFAIFCLGCNGCLGPCWLTLYLCHWFLKCVLLHNSLLRIYHQLVEATVQIAVCEVVTGQEMALMPSENSN